MFPAKQSLICKHRSSGHMWREENMNQSFQTTNASHNMTVEIVRAELTPRITDITGLKRSKSDFLHPKGTNLIALLY